MGFEFEEGRGWGEGVEEGIVWGWGGGGERRRERGGVVCIEGVCWGFGHRIILDLKRVWSFCIACVAFWVVLGSGCMSVGLVYKSGAVLGSKIGHGYTHDREGDIMRLRNCTINTGVQHGRHINGATRLCVLAYNAFQ